MSGWPEKVSAYIFDLDGVIFDSERALFHEWQLVAEKHGFRNLEEPYMKCIGVNAQTCRRIILDYYGEDFPYDAYCAESSRNYHQKYDHGRLPMKPGVKELLEELRKRGVRIAIASSTRSKIVRSEIEAAGLLDFFQEIIGGEMVCRSKPEPDIFLEAAGRLGAKPEECCVIEDSYNGILAASRAGMFPVMIPDMLPPNEEMRREAKLILPSLTELLKKLPETDDAFTAGDGRNTEMDADLTWKEISTEHLVKDQWIDFRKTTYRFPDGRVFEPYYSYTRRDFTVIVASDEEGRLICVRQFRQGLRKVTTEFPAGAIEDGDGETSEEAALRAAKRELLEETGYVSDCWRPLMILPANATISDNYAYLFAAENCRKTAEQRLDEMELIRVQTYSADELNGLIEQGEFEQALHVLAWLLRNRQGNGRVHPERIERYEHILDRMMLAAEELEKGENVPDSVWEDLRALEAYYTGPAWMEDYEADEAGLLPKDLKRGVLSQDGIDSVLERMRELKAGES